MSRSWRCRLGLHEWHRKGDDDVHVLLARCPRCGLRLSRAFLESPVEMMGGQLSGVTGTDVGRDS